MKTFQSTNYLRPVALTVAFVLFLTSALPVFCHTVRGLENPALATARITSPTTAPTDIPIPIYNTGASVGCFKVRNTSPYDAVITAIGFDLPGDYGDFNVVVPATPIFHADSAVTMEPLLDDRKLDFAFLTGPRFNSDGGKLGLHPSPQFTDICVSGQFPAGMSLETMLNFVFVRFTDVGPNGDLRDIGIWELAPRP